MESQEFVAKLAHLASRQLADYDNREPGALFASETLSVEQAYRLQTAVAELRCDRGEQIIGYKVGCTSAKIRSQLQIDQSITGRLYESERYVAGISLSRQRYVNLAIEGELAVTLSREPCEDDFRAEGIPKCVDRIFPVIELHNHVVRGEKPSAAELIANNAIHAGFVAGTGVHLTDWLDRSTNSLALSIYVGEQLVDQCGERELVETIYSSLKWLTKVVQDRGDRLEAGQVVLTGSVPSLIPIRENTNVRVDAQAAGCVEAGLIR